MAEHEHTKDCEGKLTVDVTVDGRIVLSIGPAQALIDPPEEALRLAEALQSAVAMSAKLREATQ